MKTLAAFLAAALCAAAPAVAQSEPPPLLGAGASDTFSALVGKRRERREDSDAGAMVERYVLATDGRAFLFEDHASEARVKFLCGPDDPRFDCAIDPAGPAPEIFKLTAKRGPRGDVIYKNFAGESVLRIASYGGATVFWPGDGEGFAASKSFGDDAPLRLEFEDFSAARRRAQAAAAIIGAEAGEPVSFDIGAPPAVEGANVAVLADAVLRAAKGVYDVASDATGARILASRVRKVAFAPADAAGVSFDDGVLLIRYVPDRDIDGRPSSTAIAKFLEDTL